MADNSLSNRALDRHCYKGGNECHCDWRISIHDCQESVAMWHINAISTAVSSLTVVVGAAMFVHRVLVKGHSLWNSPAVTQGCLRPRPVDSMLVLFIAFNALRVISSAILMTDAVPDNWIARSLFWEIPWSFGLGGITVYLVGIAQTISQSSSAAGWLPSPLIVDITGFIALFGPLICGVSFAIGAGAAAENNLIGTAETLIRVSYMLWFVWVASIGGAVLYASIRLVRVLESHHRKFRQGGSFATVISGIYRIQLMAASFIICLWTFAAILLLYCALRDQIMANIVGSIFIGATWSILGSFTTLIALISVLVSPNMRNNPALRSNNLTNGTSNYTTSTHPDPRGYGDSTIGAMTATSQDDTEAILYAIEANGREEQWNSQQGQLNKSKKPWNNFLSASTPSRRGSNASSQLELTSYEQDQVEALPHYR